MVENLTNKLAGLGFSLAERDLRWAKARDFMERQGLDAMLIFGEHEDAGPAPFAFDTWFTNDRSGMTVLFPKNGDMTVFGPITTYIFDHIEASRRGDGGWIVPEKFHLGNFSDNIVQAIKEEGLANATIGVIGLDLYVPWFPEGIVPYRLWNNILTQLPQSNFKPVALDFARLMMPLSEEEIAVVRHCASIGDAIAHAMVETARPGVSEAEVYAAGMYAAHSRGTVAPGMHFWTGPQHAASGPPQWTYRAQSPRILQDGDFIATEVFCNLSMRQTQHQVAIAIGNIDREIERAAEIARSCYEAGIAALRPGVPFGDVAEAMITPIEKVGGWVRGPQVHGLNPYGFICRIPGGRSQHQGAERYPEFGGMNTMLADVKLEPGMSFAFEPSCGLGGYLVTVGGTVIVGDDGPIELNPYSAKMLRAGA